MTETRNPAIVVIAYNRPGSLKRLLHSLSKSVYHSDGIPLIISIDHEDSAGHNEVVLLAAEFEWKYGEKKVIAHTSKLGLRKHILKSGEFAYSLGSIIMLKDDLQVSPYFYNYASQALRYYKDDPKIAGISLYNHKRNFCNELPFELMGESGSDVYFIQIASSWGQAWTSDQWQRFQRWYNTNPPFSSQDKIPVNIINWPETSWLKYFNKYVIESGSFFVYPKISYSTNFGDQGTHNKEADHTFQVPLCLKEFNAYNFIRPEDSINVYDAFFELLPSVLKQLSDDLPVTDFVVDMYGLKNLRLYSEKLALSSKKMNSGKYMRSYGLYTKPLPMNVIDNVEGSEFHLANINEFENEIAGVETEYRIWQYIFGKIKAKILLKKIQDKFERKILNTIHFK